MPTARSRPVFIFGFLAVRAVAFLVGSAPPTRAEEPARRVPRMAALGPAVVAEPASASGTTTTPRFLRAPDSLEALTARRRHAAIERNIGWGLAGAGMATAAVGVTLLGSSRVASLGYEEGAAYQLGGVLALSVGVLVLIPGVVLGLHGENAISDADGRLGALKQARVSSPRIHLTPLFAWLPGGAFAGAHLRF